MKKVPIVFEYIRKQDERSVKRLVMSGHPVWVIEPFYAPHHRRGPNSYPSSLPEYVEDLINEGKISLLHAKHFRPLEIELNSTDKAVDVIETIYSLYREKNRAIIELISKSVGSDEAERSFKANLAIRIAEFYSTNYLFHYIEERLPDKSITVYPDFNLKVYRRIYRLIAQAGRDYYQHPRIRFPIKREIVDRLETIMLGCKNIVFLVLQTFGNIIFHRGRTTGPKKPFKIGIAVISPRQLQGRQLSPDFLIDHKTITEKDIIYFLHFVPDVKQEKVIDSLPGTVFNPPRGRFICGNYRRWAGLLAMALGSNILRNGEEIQVARTVLFSYFEWIEILKHVRVRHFITHADFGYGHVGRNIALHQSGTETWYLTDSINLSCVYEGILNSKPLRHPFWTYLYYQHLVTWNEKTAQFFKRHPNSFEKIHIVGCLRSAYLADTSIDSDRTASLLKCGGQATFVVGAFDSTYTINATNSYQDGIAFAEDMLRLVESCVDIAVILKEKKDRSIHKILDRKLGPKLIELYDRMNKHPRITICPNTIDAADVTKVSDLVISFPFTSTTFEALSVNRPAIWHDPMGYYKNTPYGTVKGVTTHSYEELEDHVKALISSKGMRFTNPFPPNSILMDPYRDGGAIERFRELLLAHDKQRTTD